MNDEFIITIGVQQTTIMEDIKEIKEKVNSLPCEVHKNKIGMLSKVVYGFCALILLAWMSNLTPLNKTKVEPKPIKQNTEYEMVYPVIPKVKYISTKGEE